MTKTPTGTVVPNLNNADTPDTVETRMTPQEVVDLFGALVDIQDIPANPKFAYAVAKNIEALRPSVLLVVNEFNPSVEYADYEQKRVALCVVYSKRTADGQMVMNGDSFVIDDLAEFKEAVVALRTKYKDAIAAYSETCKQMAEVLTTNGVTAYLHKVEISEYPCLTPVQMECILPMLR